MAPEWADEPWHAEEGRFFIDGEEGWGSILDNEDWFIAKLEDSLDPEANAARIVACVNGLRGLDADSVPDAVQALKDCHALLEQLAEQGALGGDLAARVAARRDQAARALERLEAT